MTEYHKINAMFMRDMDKPNKPLVPGRWALPEFDYLANNLWEFTEKVDGTNIRIHLERHEDYLYVDFKGRTDNADIPKPLRAHLESQFPQSFPDNRGGERGFLVGRWMLDNDLTDVVLYGEGYGPKIQSGGLYRKDQSFVLFDVKIGDFWLDRVNVNDVAKKLGIDAVPVLGYGTLWDGVSIVKGDPPVGKHFNVTYGYWNGRDGMRSAWGDFEAEGIVARPEIPLFNRQGNRIITKIKARDFRS